MESEGHDDLVRLDVSQPIWERFFTVASLFLVGTRDEDGSWDFAPKHMGGPLGWDNYFSFVCTPRHGTYQNVRRTGLFTVTYPLPTQVVVSSLAAAPRCDDGSKPSLSALPSFPATEIEGMFVRDGYLFLECESDRIVDGFGVNSLIVGRVVAGHVRADAMRASERDDNELINECPLMAYLHPGRFASIDKSLSFPFPVGFKR
jgi:flavin reductase (DIM6/NTAB) family NADH-FMN oxidoreductase RutF